VTGQRISAANAAIVGGEKAWSLIGVAFIVVILAVIVVYLYGVRGGAR